ncbi:MAG: ribonuclease HII [bacterium]
MRNLDPKLRGNRTLICGVDEVGRGAIAGPVVAAAVILPANCRIPGVNDSKLLTPRQRAELAPLIKRRSYCWAIAAAGHRFIEHNNIVCATFWAMRLAVLKVLSRLGSHGSKSNLLVLADGWKIPDLDLPCQGILKGDLKSRSIACASIIAKVFRDELMTRMDCRFPGYGFARHKGYGTPGHIRALFQLGPSPIHRRTFEPVKSLFSRI